MTAETKTRLQGQVELAIHQGLREGERAIELAERILPLVGQLITGADLLAAIRTADAEKHPAQQAGWINGDDLRDAVLDGRFDLERVAELLNEPKP